MSKEYKYECDSDEEEYVNQPKKGINKNVTIRSKFEELLGKVMQEYMLEPYKEYKVISDGIPLKSVLKHRMALESFSLFQHIYYKERLKKFGKDGIDKQILLRMIHIKLLTVFQDGYIEVKFRNNQYYIFKSNLMDVAGTYVEQILEAYKNNQDLSITLPFKINNLLVDEGLMFKIREVLLLKSDSNDLKEAIKHLEIKRIGLYELVMVFKFSH